MSYKMKFRFEEGTVVHPKRQDQNLCHADVPVVDEETDKDTDITDPRLKEILLHARELASTYQSAPSTAHARRRRRFVLDSVLFRRSRPRLWGNDTAWSRRRPRHALRIEEGQRRPNRLHEVFLSAGAIGLTLGAVLIALVHAWIPVSAPTNVPAEVLPLADATVATSPMMALQSGAIQSDRAVSGDAVTIPAFSTLMYEAGLYHKKSDALAAERDYRSSGVSAYVVSTPSAHKVAANPEFALILGPVANPRGNPVFERVMARAQVPYFVGSWLVPLVRLPLPEISPSERLTVQKLIASDVQWLEALIAEQSGYRVAKMAAWSKESSIWGALAQPILARLGGSGGAIWSFHRVLVESQAALIQSTGQRAASLLTMQDLARATVAYTRIAE